MLKRHEGSRKHAKLGFPALGFVPPPRFCATRHINPLHFNPSFFPKILQKLPLVSVTRLNHLNFNDPLLLIFYRFSVGN